MGLFIEMTKKEVALGFPFITNFGFSLAQRKTKRLQRKKIAQRKLKDDELNTEF